MDDMDQPFCQQTCDESDAYRFDKATDTTTRNLQACDKEHLANMLHEKEELIRQQRDNIITLQSACENKEQTIQDKNEIISQQTHIMELLKTSYLREMAIEDKEWYTQIQQQLEEYKTIVEQVKATNADLIEIIYELSKSVDAEKMKVYQQGENIAILSNLCNRLGMEHRACVELIASKDEVIGYNRTTISNLSNTMESLVRTLNQMENKKRLRALERRTSKPAASVGECLENLKPKMQEFDERMVAATKTASDRYPHSDMGVIELTNRPDSDGQF